MSETPKRIQLRRTKGWRKPEGVVVVARPSKWGNPIDWQGLEYEEGYAPSPWHRRQVAAAMFRMMLTSGSPEVPSIDAIRAELAGRDLACWCPPDHPCHADVLIEIANASAAVGAV